MDDPEEWLAARRVGRVESRAPTGRDWDHGKLFLDHGDATRDFWVRMWMPPPAPREAGDEEEDDARIAAMRLDLRASCEQRWADDLRLDAELEHRGPLWCPPDPCTAAAACAKAAVAAVARAAADRAAAYHAALRDKLGIPFDPRSHLRPPPGSLPPAAPSSAALTRIASAAAAAAATSIAQSIFGTADDLYTVVAERTYVQEIQGELRGLLSFGLTASKRKRGAGSSQRHQSHRLGARGAALVPPPPPPPPLLPPPPQPH